MLLLLCSFAHLLTDAVCAAALFGPMHESDSIYFLILIYNTLAFSTQAVVGLFCDRFPNRQPYFGCGAMVLAALGYFLPLPALCKTVLIGLGNSFFHVSCGMLILIKSGKKAAKLGVFVAPGAIGLTLGTLFPQLGACFAAALLLAAVLLILAARREAPFEIEAAPEPQKPLFSVLLLAFAVAVRAIGGSVVSFPWKVGILPTLLLTLFVFLGKFGGGFLCDRIGPKRTALFSLLPALVLILFCSAWAAPSLLGQLALNLTMPVTLWLLYLELPRSTGFAFGLAASALWPGTLAGKLLTLEGAAQKIAVGFSFLFALFAILFALWHLHHNRKELIP